MMEIDFHAHILPRCDHGSDSWRTSRQQLKLAREAGVEVICATSHFYGHHTSVEHFLEKRQRCYEDLMAHAPKGSPRVLLGAEVLAFEGIERLPGLAKLRLQGTKMLLLEMPFTRWSDGLLESVEALSEDERFRIVLAHVDRYDRRAVEQLFELNYVRGQLNVDNLKKRFDKITFGPGLTNGHDCRSRSRRSRQCAEHQGKGETQPEHKIAGQENQHRGAAGFQHRNGNHFSAVFPERGDPEKLTGAESDESQCDIRQERGSLHHR